MADAAPGSPKSDKKKSGKKDHDEEEDDDTWLYYSRKPLTTREILDAGFSNCVLVDADEWRHEEGNLLKKVADDVQYSFAITADIESFDAGTRTDFEKEMLEWLRWGDADVLIVICDSYDKDWGEEDRAWHMVKKVVNLIETAYAEGLKREYDDLPGVSVVLERGPSKLSGEWEDGKKFEYEVASWEKAALGYEDDDEWWEEDEEWGEEWHEEEAAAGASAANGAVSPSQGGSRSPKGSASPKDTAANDGSFNPASRSGYKGSGKGNKGSSYGGGGGGKSGYNQSYGGGSGYGGGKGYPQSYQGY